MTVRVTVKSNKKILDLLTRIENKLDTLLVRQTFMAQELERLTTEVAETKTVIDSAITLLNNLAAMIRDNAGNPAALNALADDLDAKQAELAKAITDNTPSA